MSVDTTPPAPEDDVVHIGRELDAYAESLNDEYGIRSWGTWQWRCKLVYDAYLDLSTRAAPAPATEDDVLNRPGANVALIREHLDEIDRRVSPTICPTVGMREGELKETREGRIQSDDFQSLMGYALGALTLSEDVNTLRRAYTALREKARTPHTREVCERHSIWQNDPDSKCVNAAMAGYECPVSDCPLRSAGA